MYSRNWVEFEAVTELPERLETVLLVSLISQSNQAAQGGVMTGNHSDINGGTNGNVYSSGINQQNFAKVLQGVWSGRRGR